MGIEYPEPIRNLPKIDVGDFTGVEGFLLQGEHNQVGFFQFDEPGEAHEHAHGFQWGVVIQGEIELTIGDETRTYRAGEAYYIPEGVPHSGHWEAGLKTIDFFDDPDRYQTVSSSP